MKIEISHQILYGRNNYFITRDGRVKNIETNTYLTNWLDGQGYYCVKINQNRKQKNLKIHRLLAIAFIPNPENKLTVDHIDRNPKNNNLNNLRWATQSEQNINKRQHLNKHNINKYIVKYFGTKKNQKKYPNYIRYNVMIHHLKHKSKLFKTIDDAKKYRDNFLKSKNLLHLLEY